MASGMVALRDCNHLNLATAPAIPIDLFTAKRAIAAPAGYRFFLTDAGVAGVLNIVIGPSARPCLGISRAIFVRPPFKKKRSALVPSAGRETLLSPECATSASIRRLGHQAAISDTIIVRAD